MNNKPSFKPNNPNFASGPTTKRPNWSLSNLEASILGRSHRSAECKKKLLEVIEKSKNNEQSIIVYPLIEETETQDLEAALQSYVKL